MKQAQIRIGETIAVLFIFFILLVFGFVFYSRIQAGQITQEKEESLAQKSIKFTQVMSYLPELQCSKINIPISINCLDLYKIRSAQNLFKEQRNTYFEAFGINATVKAIYPEEQTIVVFEDVPPNWNSRVQTPVPISLYDPINNTYSLGILTVSVYK